MAVVKPGSRESFICEGKDSGQAVDGASTTVSKDR